MSPRGSIQMERPDDGEVQAIQGARGAGFTGDSGFSGFFGDAGAAGRPAHGPDKDTLRLKRTTGPKWYSPRSLRLGLRSGLTTYGSIIKNGVKENQAFMSSYGGL